MATPAEFRLTTCSGLLVVTRNAKDCKISPFFWSRSRQVIVNYKHPANVFDCGSQRPVIIPGSASAWEISKRHHCASSRPCALNLPATYCYHATRIVSPMDNPSQYIGLLNRTAIHWFGTELCCAFVTYTLLTFYGQFRSNDPISPRLPSFRSDPWYGCIPTTTQSMALRHSINHSRSREAR